MRCKYYAVVLGVFLMAGVAWGAFDTVGLYDVDDAPYNNNVEQSAVFKEGVDATYVIDLPTFQDLLAVAYPLDAGGVVNAEAPGALEEDGSILGLTCMRFGIVLSIPHRDELIRGP